MELIFVSIEHPVGMARDEAVRRAKALVPVRTGAFETDDEGEGNIVGNLECEDGYYAAHPDGCEYGPDDAGVEIAWETP